MSDRQLVSEARALLHRWMTDSSWEVFAPAGLPAHLDTDTQAWLDEAPPPKRAPEPWRARLKRYLERERGEVVFRIPEDLDALIADWKQLGGKL